MNVLDDFASDVPALLVHHRPRREGPELRQVVPAAVARAEQLPPYLMLGTRDESSFRTDEDGWSAVWTGMEPGTELRWRFRRSANTDEISHRWRGIDGAASTFPTDVRVEQTIACLYAPLPRRWDEAAQSLFSAHWHVVYLSASSTKRATVFFPDGPFREVIVPRCVERAAGFARRWVRLVRDTNPPFPLAALLRRMRCDTAYVHGCHGLDDPGPLLARCKRQTGRAAARTPPTHAPPGRSSGTCSARRSRSPSQDWRGSCRGSKTPAY